MPKVSEPLLTVKLYVLFDEYPAGAAELSAVFAAFSCDEKGDDLMAGRITECPECGTQLKAYHKFCPTCGKELTGSTDPEQNIIPERPRHFADTPSAGGSTAQNVPNQQPGAYPPQSTGNMAVGGFLPPQPAYMQYPPYPEYPPMPPVDTALEREYRETRTHNRRTVLIWVFSAIGIILVISLAAFIIKYQSDKNAAEELAREQKAAYEEYMTTAQDFYTLSGKDAVKLIEIGSDIKSYWYNAVWNDKYNGDIDLAVNNALLDNSSKLSVVESDHDTLKLKFDKLCNVPDGKKFNEMAAVKEEAEELWYSYKKLYDTVVTPTGSLTEFSSTFTAASTDFADDLERSTHISSYGVR